MDRDIVQSINYFTFSKVNKLFKKTNFAISIYDKNLFNYLEDTKKMGLGHILINGYSVNNNKPEMVIASVVWTNKDKCWSKKNIGKHEQKYGHKFFIFVDEKEDAWLIDCRNDDIKNFGEKYLGKFCAETMKHLCPDTVFTDLQPYSMFSAYAFRDRKIKFSEDDSIDVFNEKLEQKYNEISNSLKRRIITQIINIAKQKGETK